MTHTNLHVPVSGGTRVEQARNGAGTRVEQMRNRTTIRRTARFGQSSRRVDRSKMKECNLIDAAAFLFSRPNRYPESFYDS